MQNWLTVTVVGRGSSPFRFMALFANINIPEVLVDAQIEGNLLVFCGSGISIDPPANMPGMNRLVAKLNAKRLSETNEKGAIRPQDLLEQLFRLDSERNIKESIRQEYNQKSLPNRLHHCIVRLFENAESVRLITTNHDCLLSKACKSAFKREPEVIAYPRLETKSIATQLQDELQTAFGSFPFRGIAHIHGSAKGEPEDLVVGRRDFASAYMGERIVERFLNQVIKVPYVLFLGVGSNDEVLTYYLHTLPDKNKMYALAPRSETGAWNQIGINTIPYNPPTEEGPHEELNLALQEWAEKVQGGELDWATLSASSDSKIEQDCGGQT